MIDKKEFISFIINQLTLEDERYYDEDKILFYVNMALETLNADLDLNLKIITLDLIANEEHPLPNDLIKIVGFKYNNQKIDFINYQQYANSNCDSLLVNNNAILSKKNAKIELIYTFSQRLSVNDNFIDIPTVCKKALYYQVMSLAKEMLIAGHKSLEQATYFRNLYYEEIKKLNDLNIKHKRKLTKYVKV